MKLSLLCPLLLSSLLCAAPQDWPQFRGPDGQGHSAERGVPFQWSEEKNVAWKSAVPGKGWSSPVIFDNQVWMTSAKDEGKSLFAICLDKTSGQLLHNVEVFPTLFLVSGDFSGGLDSVPLPFFAELVDGVAPFHEMEGSIHVSARVRV